ncbi:hypothetical protein SD71_02735 [Cohnella kolymensis]|uniref:DUF192 domain-containing protein n=1 Tax=Cohnella kolymensis TaxID=1590652 RepID=A0ABR5A983_9BACL|nr:DUF192 domain-containing protein [Cohnella kolymensis]KIL37551.1 hypothetical protein SD71_02735 [Cohnella kolymensis]
MKLFIEESGQLLGHQVVKAYSFLRRLRGLMFTAALSEGHGLHIRPCRSVHSFFMKYSIDVLHLDETNQIVGIEHSLKPGTIGKNFQGTRSVVELPAGTLEPAGVRIGQTAVLEHS